jgi:hypothetical protein
MNPPPGETPPACREDLVTAGLTLFFRNLGHYTRFENILTKRLIDRFFLDYKKSEHSIFNMRLK